MTASHFLSHLIKAYRQLHPVSEQSHFLSKVERFERMESIRQLESHLSSIEESYGQGSPKLLQIKERIEAAKRKVS